MLFKDYYQKTPKQIQEVVGSFETSETLAQIAVNHKVDNNKGVGNRDLGRLTGQVLVGMLHPKDFVPALVEKLEIPKERAQKIAKEVNQKIFSQVKDLLIEIYGLKKGEKTIRQTPSPSSEKPSVVAESLPTPPAQVGGGQDSGVAKPSFTEKYGAVKKKEGFAEIKIPKKPETPSNIPIVKKDLSNKKSENLPLPPTGGGERKPLVPVPTPVPQVPQKNSLLKNAPMPPIPKPPQDLNQQADHVEKEPVGPPTQETGLKNPFEEKLRQTFTIPKKDPALNPPQDLNQLADHARLTPKKDSVEDIEKEAKKETVTKDPYLETPE